MLFINNDEVEKVLTMEDTLRVIEEGHKEWARGELAGRPRVDVYTETPSREKFHRWGTMEGSSKSLQRFAIRMKSDVVSWPVRHGVRVEDKYCVSPGLYCGFVFLFSTEDGAPLAIINDGYLQHMRVAALYALGAKYLARKNASTVGMLGSGGMARTHLTAFTRVRSIKQAKVFSPTKDHRELYAREMSAKLGIEVIPCRSAEEAARGADILASCTNAKEPTVYARLLESGMHLTQVSREFADDVNPKLDVCIGGGPASQVVEGAAIDDSHGFPTYLAGSLDVLRRAMGPGRAHENRNKNFRGRLVALADLIDDRVPGRLKDEEISASSGIKVGGEDSVKGLQFVTVGSLIYDRACEAGLGKKVPSEWFLQTIRD
ncbi:MAG TPA: ornithine cyclodeaminase family protein [Verrucomicrobiae bacterium]|nr:ornithine cyclodeaminase family protein [Verrucomicrobiae bacterium]